MDWREATIGAHVNGGWVPLVEELHRRVLELDPDVTVVQVKEKFGMLRYYYDVSDRAHGEHNDEIRAVVDQAAAASGYLCEVCGRIGHTDSWGHNWLFTLCEEHGAARREQGSPPWQMAQTVGGR